MDVSYLKKECQNEYWRNLSSTPSGEISKNLYKWLVPTSGREPRQDGGVTKGNISSIPRPAEDTPNEHTQFPVELLTTQDHENEGIE
jgi:hypothetical protein